MAPQRFRYPVVRLLLFLFGPLLLLNACAGGGGSGGGPTSFSEDGAPPPSSVTLASSGGGVRVDWEPVPGAHGYAVYWSRQAGVDPASASRIPAAAPPAVVPVVGGASFHAVVVSIDAEGEGPPSVESQTEVERPSPQRYFPSWADAEPRATLFFDHDPSQSDEENGAALAAAVQNLQPGDRLEIGSGTYSVPFAFRISLLGTAQEPIWIVAQAGANPVITRPDASQNALEIGTSGRAEYLCLRGLEITGGDIGVRIHDAAHVWMDECHVHDTRANAIAANSAPTHHLYFTRNEVHGTGDTGEGFYIGGNYADPVAHDCVIALNHVHDTGGRQGDGIEVKEGSFGNWIAENVVHDTNYPCILVGGTRGERVNVVERNVCWNSGDNVMQVQGDAIVRNNLLFSGLTGFHTGDHQGPTRNLVFVHNTVIDDQIALSLSDVSGRPGMVFANNALYSQGSAVRCNGSQGLTVSDNVVLGSVVGWNGGYVLGTGLSDFEDVRWNGQRRNAAPTRSGPLAGGAGAAHAALDDLGGLLRLPPYDIGAIELP